LIKLASIIEVSAKKGTRDLKLQGKLIGCLILQGSYLAWFLV